MRPMANVGDASKLTKEIYAHVFSVGKRPRSEEAEEGKAEGSDPDLTLRASRQGKHPGETIRWQAIASWRIDLRTAPLDALFEHDHAREYAALAERIHERPSIDRSFLTGTFNRA